VIPALGRVRQEHREFKAGLGYIVKSQKKRGNLDTRRHKGCTRTKEGPCEDTGEDSICQQERGRQEKSTLPAP
jgi:hypothetical protein